MKKAFAIAVAVALLLTPAVVYACSSHGSIAANDIRNYLRGNSSGYGSGKSDESAGALAQFSVWGGQGGAGLWNSNRTYWVELTSPFGERVRFQTTWGQIPNGWAIENFLSDTGIAWVENWFDSKFGKDGKLIRDGREGNSTQKVEECNG